MKRSNGKEMVNQLVSMTHLGVKLLSHEPFPEVFLKPQPRP